MLLIAIFFVSGADAASMVMGKLSIAAIMLLVGGGEGTALTGIQNITIIMAAPFGIVMVLLCVALAKGLRSDPLVRRNDRSAQAVEQAVVYGTKNDGDRFFLPVKPHPTSGKRDISTNGSPAGTTAAPATEEVPRG